MVTPHYQDKKKTLLFEEQKSIKETKPKGKPLNRKTNFPFCSSRPPSSFLFNLTISLPPLYPKLFLSFLSLSHSPFLDLRGIQVKNNLVFPPCFLKKTWPSKRKPKTPQLSFSSLLNQNRLAPFSFSSLSLDDKNTKTKCTPSFYFLTRNEPTPSHVSSKAFYSQGPSVQV